MQSPSPTSTDERFLAQADCDRMIQHMLDCTRGGGTTFITIQSIWEGGLRWARNRTSLASNRRRIEVQVTRVVLGADQASASTNQIDDTSLQAVIQAAERSANLVGRRPPIHGFSVPAPTLPLPETHIWSDATFNATDAMRGEVARRLCQSAEAKGMLSAGYLEMRAGQRAQMHHDGTSTPDTRYDRYTDSRCSMTVRDPGGTGSGWAGSSSYDWTTIDGNTLAQRALQKCIASQNPVRVEPGRYTVILEPQAVAQLLAFLFPYSLTVRPFIEYSGTRGPYMQGMDPTLGIPRTKLGQKIFDDRVTIRHDPADPAMGVLPGTAQEPVLPMTWVKNGVLTTLPYDRKYALEALNENLPEVWRSAFRMDGGTTSVSDMIASTRRGILVTHFSNIRLLDQNSLLLTGLTRDGLWLIEKGKISKAIKNFRFTESPLYVLNQIDALGAPTRVLTDRQLWGEPLPIIVPPIKVKDFSFTSLVDAV